MRRYVGLKASSTLLNTRRNAGLKNQLYPREHAARRWPEAWLYPRRYAWQRGL